MREKRILGMRLRWNWPLVGPRAPAPATIRNAHVSGWQTCGSCGQSVRYGDENPGRMGVWCCPRCLCAPGEPLPPPASAGGPSVLVHVYRTSARESDPLGTYAREAAALARAGWRVRHQTQSGQVFVGLRGWQPAVVTVTYERA